jgi:hypothetical protein
MKKIPPVSIAATAYIHNMAFEQMAWLSFFLRRMLTSSMFLLFRKIFTAIQSMYWELNGTAKHLRKCSDPKYYSRYNVRSIDSTWRKSIYTVKKYRFIKYDCCSVYTDVLT